MNLILHPKKLSPVARVLTLFMTILVWANSELEAQNKIQELFINPPQEARPRGYWIWAHGNFDYSTITEELREFKKKGLGGVDIYDMGISDPYDIIPPGNAFLSDQMMDGIEFALKEAANLDLAMGLSVSNGWNAGGDWTKPDEMIMRLLFWKDTLQGPVRLNAIGFPEIPRTFEKSYGTFDLFPQFNADGFPVYYENVALIAYPLTQNNLVNDLKKIIYLDTDKIKGNAVDISLPEGNWVLARAVVTPLGQKMWVSSERSNGFIMDHYSVKATRNHFNYVIGRLEDRLGNLKETSLERLYLASFEAEDYIIWSPLLKETFYAYHDYEMDPYIPVLAGLTVVDKETTKRFLYDYRLTVSEMFVNNHYRQARDISNDHGLLLASESGGPGPPLHYVPTEDLKALGSVNIMRGEFWNREPEYFDEYGNDLTYVVKNIASAAHIYGHRIVEMEAFTSHRKHWQERPMELKKLADEAFCTGMTRVVYHTMPHSPKEAGYPGWSYQAGTHISPKMAWWKLSKPFHDYLARISTLLQEGNFVADVAYYYGEEIPNFATGAKFIRKSLGKGYDYDDLNKEILLVSFVNDKGQLELPSGMKYNLLVLPDNREMSLEVLHKIESLLKEGAIILGDKPITIPGLKDYQKREVELKDLADRIWKGSKKKKSKRNYGKGSLYTGYPEREILIENSIEPDFKYSNTGGNPVNLDYIHRATEGDDIYFIRNVDSLQVHTWIDVRVDGKQVFLMDPAEGRIQKLAMYIEEVGRTKIPLRLSPYGSAFIVLSGDSPTQTHVVKMEKNEQVITSQNSDFSGILTYQNDEIIFMPRESGNYRFTLNNGSVVEAGSSYKDIPVVLDNPWEVYFPYGWGFDPIQKFDKLQDWTKHPDSKLSIFSGSATYKTTFHMEGIDHQLTYRLDLGQVGDAAAVYLNGHKVGASVFPPFVFNIEGLLRERDNYLVIEVANTWLNQLIGESNKPYDQQRTRSNLGSGDREDGSRPWSSYNPLPSGLMGPVKLKVCERIKIDL